MENMWLEFLNLFLAPVVGLLILDKKKYLKITADVRYLLWSMFFIVINFLVDTIILFLIRVLTGREYGIASGFYTMFAFVTAAGLPFLIDLVRFMHREGIRDKDSQ